MTIQRKLSKTQARVFIALAQQRRELQAAWQEVQQAEGEQVEMLRRHYDLPEGEYRLRQDEDGSLSLVRAPDAEAPDAEPEEGGAPE